MKKIFMLIILSTISWTFSSKIKAQCNVTTSGSFTAPSCSNQSVGLGAGESRSMTYAAGYYSFSYANNAQSNGICINATQYTANPTGPLNLSGTFWTGMYRNSGTWSGTSATLTYKRVGVATSAGTISIAHTSSVCMNDGGSISASNVTSGTVDVGSPIYIWYVGYSTDGGATYGGWKDSWTPGNAITTAAGTGASLSSYNPQSDHPGYTHYRIYRRVVSDCQKDVNGNWASACLAGCFDNYFNVVIGPNATQALGNITCGPAAGLTGALADGNFSASGCWNGGPVNTDCSSPGTGGHQAWRGRVFRDVSDGGVVGWAVDQNNTGDFWQVDLGSIRPVNGIASQGREDAAQWLTQYTVQLSYDGSSWFTVPGTFTANSDQNTVVTNWFGQFHARYVRVNTINSAYSGHQSARFEVLSIPEDASNTVVLSADIVPYANQVRWYTVPSGGTPITTGGSYTVGTNGRTLQVANLTTNTTFYAEAYNSSTGCTSPSRTAVIARVNNIYGCGPAGIGSTSGNSLNNLWLDGNIFNSTANGTAVSTWADKSGRGNNATQGTATNQPTVQTDAAMNNQKLVRGDGTNDFISTPNNIYNYSGSFYGSNATPFAVWGVSRYRGTNGRLISGNGNNWLLGHHGGLEQRAYYNGWLTGSCTGGGIAATGNTRIVGGDRNRYWSRFFDNGTLITEANCGSEAPGGFTLFSYIGTGEWSNGDIAEVIAYELPLNTARRRILENYLSAKYNTAIASDLYAGDNTANGDFDFDVTGVGRDFGNGIGYHLAGCSEGLTISTTIANFLKDDGDYMLLGHNRLTLYSWENSNLATCGTPNPSRRLSRIWYIDKTDVGTAGGNVTLTFDIGTTPISGTYRLLYRSGTTGNFSSVATHSSISGNTVVFTVNATSINDGQYTLGYDADIPRSISFASASSQYLNNASPTGLNLGSTFTVEAWVRPNATQSDATYNGIVSWGSRTCTGTSMLLSIDNNLRPTMATWCNDYVPGSGTALTAGEWNHLACVVNGTSVQFYINGSLSHSGTLGSTPNVQNGALNIGCTDNPGRYFNGQIDEVRIWNTARSATQISNNLHTNFNADSSGWTNLVAYYKMNEASGTVFDHSRNANNLSRINSPTVVALHPATPGSISAQTICSGASTTYTVTNSNANSRLTYSWSVPSGVTIVSGGSTSTVSVSSTNSGTSVQTYTLTVTETHSNECYTETQTATLNVRPVPQATISGTVTVCKDAPSPVITFTNPTTLQVEVTYKINGGADQFITVNASSSATVTAPTSSIGTFNYVIQSVKFTTAPDCGVSASGTATVTVVADPAISGLSAATICKGGTHTYTPTLSGGTGTPTYIWEYNSGSWAAVANGTPAGFSYTQTGANLQINTTSGVGAATYQYRLRFQSSGSGCDEAISTVNLVVIDKPSITSSPSSTNICEGNSVSLSVSASGGITPYTYVWQYYNGSMWVNAAAGTPTGASYTGLGTSNITINGLSGGTGSAYYGFRCVVQSNGGSGCDDATSATATVGVHKYPDITNSSTAMCQGDTKTLTTDLDLTSGVTWTSSPCGSCVSGNVFTAPNPGGLSANYTLTARNANYTTCSNFFIQTVYQTNNITSSSADMCEGDTRALTATPAGGSFSGTGVSGTTFTAPTPSGSSQSYTITYTVVGSACPAATQNILVYRNPTTSNAGSDFSSCGLTATLSGNNPTYGTGLWTTVSGPGTVSYSSSSSYNSDATASTTGTYTLRWTISNGACSPSQDDVNVTYYNSLTASSTPDTILVCTDSIVDITGSVSGGYGTQTYAWQYYDDGSGNWVAAPGVNNTINYTTNPLTNTSTSLDAIYRFRLQYSRSGCSGSVYSNETYARVFAVPSLTGTNDECVSIIGGNNYDYIYTTGTALYSPFTVSDYSGGATLVFGPTEAFKIYRIPFGAGLHTFQITDNNGCKVFSDIGKSSALPTTVPHSSVAGTATGNCFIKNFDEWVHVKRASNPNEVIASIKDNDVDLGIVNVTSYRDTHALVIPNSGPVCIGAPISAMRRHFVITSTNYNDPAVKFVNSLSNPTTVTVRLYFTDSDFVDLKAAALANDTTGATCDYDDNVYQLNDLYVTKYSDYDLLGTENDDYGDNNPIASYYKVFSPQTATALIDSANGFNSTFGTSGANIHYVEMELTEFSEFWLHGSGNGSPLPVEMLFLEAKNINNSYIQINWATATELNNWKFEVERSTDGVNFTKIGEVIGNGTSTDRHDYTYNDKNVVPGIRYYYRLKQIDFDESYEYSPVVSEMLRGDDLFKVSDFVPNPAADQAKLIITTGKEQEVQIEMHNYLGEIVKKGSTYLNKGSNTINFDFADLAAGTYTTRVVAGTNTHIRRVVITR